MSIAKRILTLLCTLALVCAAALAQQDTTVATIGTRVISNDELTAAYIASYGDYAEGDADLEFSLKLEILDMLMQEEAERQMIAQKGFDSHTPEELAAAAETGREEYAQTLAYYMELLSFYSDSGSTNAQLKAEAEALLAASDMSEEDMIAQAISNLGYIKLREWALADLQVTDRDIQANYAQMVEDDRALYENYPDEFVSCMLYGIPCLYVPTGMREVRQIVIAFDSDQAEEYAILTDAAAQGSDVREDVQALYGTLNERVQMVYDQLAAGVPFAEVENLYSDAWLLPQYTDEGICCVSGSTTFWDADFKAAAMALNAVGDISQPLQLADGVYILCYAANLPAGPVAFESVASYVEEATRYMAEVDTYSAAMSSWLEALNAEIFLEQIH